MAVRTKSEPRLEKQKPSRPAMKAAPEPPPATVEPAAVELVTCFMSGRVVPRDQAVLVKLGPGQRFWMLPEFINDERDRRG